MTRDFKIQGASFTVFGCKGSFEGGPQNAVVQVDGVRLW